MSKADFKYTRLSNEIMENLACTYMSSYESQFLWCLFRRTYGWHKKEDAIPLSEIAAATGIHRSHISRTKKKLLHRRIVTQTGNKIAFNKYHSQWLKLPKQVTSKPDEVVPKQAHKDTQTGTFAGTQTGTPLLIKENLKQVKETPFACSSETEALYSSIDELCVKYGIQNNVKKKSLDVLVARYVGKLKMKVELQHCISWLVDKNLRAITTQRIGNWFKKAQEIQKRDLNKQLEYKEARNNPSFAAKLKDERIDQSVETFLQSQ